MSVSKKIVYAQQIRSAILRVNPAMAYIVDHVPAVEAKPIVHAKWLVPDEHYPDTCSNCNFEFVWDGDENYHPKYCPDCGAQMDVE